MIDSKAQLTLLGTEMDYVENKLSAEFVFINPNVTGTCGCGESFSVWRNIIFLMCDIYLDISWALTHENLPSIVSNLMNLLPTGYIEI